MSNADLTPGRAIRPSLVPFDPLVIQPVRLTDRLLAFALGSSLDQQLAAGRSPESSPALAARARRIVALPRRMSLARSWDHALRVAHRVPARRTPVVPLNAAAIRAAELEIRELITRLSAPLPVTAQGVAAATILLTDVASPVYRLQRPDGLADQLDIAIARLDPAQPLMGAV